MNTQESPRSSPSLPPTDDEAALWQALRNNGSAYAREKLFSLHFDFARRIARRQWLDRRSGDIEFQDLCQLASAGLLEAIDRYDADIGVPFRGYAARRISGSIVDGVGKMSEVREQISFRNRARRDRARSLAAAGADSLPVDEAMRVLTELAVGLAIGFMLDEGLYVIEGERDRASNAYESLAWKDTIRRMLEEIGGLPEREQIIIRHHYLTGLTFDQIGAVLGVTKGRVSQMHQAAIGLLRKRLRHAGDFKLER